MLRFGCQQHRSPGIPDRHKHISCIVFGGDGDIKGDRVANGCKTRCSGGDGHTSGVGNKGNGVLYFFPLGVKLQVGGNGGGEEPLCRVGARRSRVPAVEGVALALGRDGFGGRSVVLDGLRRGQGVHIIAVRAERHGVVRRSRGRIHQDILHGIGNTGCAEKSSLTHFGGA